MRKQGKEPVQANKVNVFVIVIGISIVIGFLSHSFCYLCIAETEEKVCRYCPIFILR